MQHTGRPRVNNNNNNITIIPMNTRWVTLILTLLLSLLSSSSSSYNINNNYNYYYYYNNAGPLSESITPCWSPTLLQQFASFLAMRVVAETEELDWGAPAIIEKRKIYELRIMPNEERERSDINNNINNNYYNDNNNYGEEEGESEVREEAGDYYNPSCHYESRVEENNNNNNEENENKENEISKEDCNEILLSSTFTSRRRPHRRQHRKKKTTNINNNNSDKNINEIISINTKTTNTILTSSCSHGMSSSEFGSESGNIYNNYPSVSSTINNIHSNNINNNNIKNINNIPYNIMVPSPRPVWNQLHVIDIANTIHDNNFTHITQRFLQYQQMFPIIYHCNLNDIQTIYEEELIKNSQTGLYNSRFWSCRTCGKKHDVVRENCVRCHRYPSSPFTKLFFGQILKENNINNNNMNNKDGARAIIRLLHATHPGIKIHRIEMHENCHNNNNNNNNKDINNNNIGRGCASVYINSDAAIEIVNKLNGNVFFDADEYNYNINYNYNNNVNNNNNNNNREGMSGVCVYYVYNSQKKWLQEFISSRTLNRKYSSILPWGALVVEESNNNKKYEGLTESK